MLVGDGQLDPGESPSLFESIKWSRPERLILTIRDSCVQDLLVPIFPHSGDHEDSLSGVPRSLVHLVT